MARNGIDPRSVVVGGPAEHGTVAEHGDRAVLAHRDEGGLGIVMAVSATRRVTSAAERLNGRLGVRAGYQPNAELPERSLGVEHGRSVDLGQRMAEGSEMRDGLNLLDGGWYAQDPHAIWTELRREAPVYYDPLGQVCTVLFDPTV